MGAQVIEVKCSPDHARRLAAFALNLDQAEISAALQILAHDVERLRAELRWAYVNVGPIAMNGIGVKERVRRLNAYRDHLDAAGARGASDRHGQERS